MNEIEVRNRLAKALAKAYRERRDAQATLAIGGIARRRGRERNPATPFIGPELWEMALQSRRQQNQEN